MLCVSVSDWSALSLTLPVMTLLSSVITREVVVTHIILNEISYKTRISYYIRCILLRLLMKGHLSLNSMFMLNKVQLAYLPQFSVKIPTVGFHIQTDHIQDHTYAHVRIDCTIFRNLF